MSPTILNNHSSLVLAPMDGVTDAFMRGYLTQLMPFTHCVSEFVRVNADPPSRKTLITDIPELLTGSKTGAGTPVHVQILGGKAEPMAEAASLAVSLGAKAVDINFGCPAPTVNRHDGGATLLKFPDRIKEIVSAVRSAVPADVPVSAKLRLGWDDPMAIHLNAEMAAVGGASWITIHGRTKFQGYIPPAYWKPIGVVRRNLSIPVIANGEIWTVNDLKRCQDETECSHFMLGRGVLADPTLAQKCADYLGILRSPLTPVSLDLSSWQEVLPDVINRSRSLGESERRTLARLKQWLNYAKKRGNVTWFDSVKRTTSCEEFQRSMPTV